MPKFYTFFKWLILLASYLFLAYKLVTFNQYRELAAQWNQISFYQVAWLVGVFALLPLNLFLEAIKWKKLTSVVQKISYKSAFKAVLSGIFTGFFTPNRVGELVGRIMFLSSQHRKAGVTLSIMNSITQNLTMALWGIPATILFFTTTPQNLSLNLQLYLIILLVCLLILGLIYLFLPTLSHQIKKSRFSSQISPFTDCILGFKTNNLLQIMLVSWLRYIVFCTQFFFMLQFFSIDLSVWHAVIAIPTTYLFVTFTPSFAFSEVAIRSSYSVLVIGIFSANVVGIALAGVCIWAVNFIIPMLVGSVVMVGKKDN